ncbi:MAG: tellurite resistance-related uncharacterized protein [Limisphaerales bacterium]|jgi:tellurite resistance-related uncharacterized protein
MESIPEQCSSYKKTAVFSEASVPGGLLKAHKTKTGTWGKIVILEGQLLYRILEPILEEHLLDADHPGVVEPEVLHEVKPEGKVSFYVDFHK